MNADDNNDTIFNLSTSLVPVTCRCLQSSMLSFFSFMEAEVLDAAMGLSAAD